MQLICVAMTLLNLTSEPFIQRDFNILSRAQIVCEKTEGCVTSFQKRGNNTYRILCGKKVEFSRKELDKYELKMLLLEMDELGNSEKVKKEKLKEILND